MKHRIGKVKNKVVVEGGGTNTLKNNEVLVEGNTIKIKENGQVSNISGGSSNINNTVIYIKTSNDIAGLGYYSLLLMSVRHFGLESKEYKIIEFPMGYDKGVSDNWKSILNYYSISCKYNVPTNSTGNEYNTWNSLEEFEQLYKLDSNNRPFKIITEEEFYKDLTEEEARKIASEL